MNTSIEGGGKPASLRDGFRACLLGGAVGDALGAPVEFLSRAEIVDRFGNSGIRDFVPAYGRLGAITDDTQMSLFTAEGLLEAANPGRDGKAPDLMWSIHRSYLRWYSTQGGRVAGIPGAKAGMLLEQKELQAQRGPGNTCLSALGAVAAAGLGKPALNNSKGCGGLMRVAPVGLFHAAGGAEGPEGAVAAFRDGSASAALTHGHPGGQLPSGYFAALVYHLICGRSLSEGMKLVRPLLIAEKDHDETLRSIDLALELAEGSTPPEDCMARLGEGWIAPEALGLALFAALRAPNFEEGIVLAVNIDGDSDSVGSIAGNLLGPIHGLASIPERWLGPLELRPLIEDMADRLAEIGG